MYDFSSDISLFTFSHLRRSAFFATCYFFYHVVIYFQLEIELWLTVIKSCHFLFQFILHACCGIFSAVCPVMIDHHRLLLVSTTCHLFYQHVLVCF